MFLQNGQSNRTGLQYYDVKRRSIKNTMKMRIEESMLKFFKNFDDEFYFCTILTQKQRWTELAIKNCCENKHKTSINEQR